ncbi:MAG TPA: hypothetical protein VFS52_12670 [Steroidobacteraceae bacterium]|nr:hypothetical protein [Steroidobacteraceae bacterium]
MLSFIERRVAPACSCPRDPAASTGVVVAEIEVTPDGRLISIGILEAPTLLVAHCVQSALSGWTFRAIGGESSVRYWTKIFFYSIADGRGGITVQQALPAPSRGA